VAPATLSMVKERNTTIILDLLMNNKFSRAELSRATGLTRSTVGEIIKEMLDLGVVQEGKTTSGKIGRPAIKIGIRKDWAYVIGVSVERNGVSARLIDSNKNILKSSEIVKLRTYSSLKELQSDIYKVVDETYHFAHTNKIRISAMGIGMPGPFDPLTGSLKSVPSFPVVENFSPKLLLEGKYNVSVWVGNDADMGALGEKYFGKGKNLDSFIYVFLDKGIGSGIVINGELYVGISGYAGELGQLTIVKGKREIFLEKLCSVDSIIKKTRSIGVDDLNDLKELAKAGNKLAIDTIVEVARHIGCGIVSLIYLFGIPNIIVGGMLLELGDLFLNKVRETIKRNLFHKHEVQLLKSDLGNQTISLGAASYALVKHTITKLRERKILRKRNIEIWGRLT